MWLEVLVLLLKEDRVWVEESGKLELNANGSIIVSQVGEECWISWQLL